MKLFDSLDFDGMKMEFLGTFGVVYMGGWAYINYFLNKSDFLSVGMTHLFSYALFIWAGFSISGGHYNPGQTAVLMFFKRLHFFKGLFYIFAQLIGSLLAASLLKLLSPEVDLNLIRDKGFLIGFPQPQVPILWAAVYEGIGAFFIVLVYYLVVISKETQSTKIYGMAIGTTYCANIMMFGIMTGAGSNVARFFGPIFISKNYLTLLIYTAGSLVGAAGAGFLCEYILLKGVDKGSQEAQEGDNIEHLGEPAAKEDSFEAPKAKNEMIDLSADLDQSQMRDTQGMEL